MTSMKIRSGTFILLAVLTLSQLRCSAASPVSAVKQGSMVIHTFIDYNLNGTPDEGDEMLAGVQLAYGGFGSQPTNEGGTATFAVHLENEEGCLYLNEQKPITVLPPPGYMLKEMEVGPWNCELSEQGSGASFTVSNEDNFAYLRFERQTDASLPPPVIVQEVPPTLTPLPMPMFVETATLLSQPKPALTLEAITRPATFSRTGVEIKFSYRFTNTGDVTLTGPFILKDLTSDPSTIFCSQYLETAVIGPGQFIDCGGSRKSREPDIEQGVIGNVITISVTYVDPLSGSSFAVSAEAQTGSVYIKP
jgi:hypothetical protein